MAPGYQRYPTRLGLRTSPFCCLHQHHGGGIWGICQQDIDDLQQDLNRLFNWTKESLSKFHPDKCVSMRIGNKPDLRTEYSMDDNIVSSSIEEKDLGVFIDSKLSFDKHIPTKVTKATALVNLIRRSFEYLDKGMFKMLFTSIVRPTRCGTLTYKSTLLLLKMYSAGRQKWFLVCDT